MITGTWMQSIKALENRVPAYVFVNNLPFFGEPSDTSKLIEVAKEAGAIVITGEWSNEVDHRNAAAQHLKGQGFTHAVIVDGDEIIESSLLDAMLEVVKYGFAERIYVYMDTYWKTPEYVIRPRERLTPCMLMDLHKTQFTMVREVSGGRGLFLGPDYGVMHHLSWAGPEERIRRKLETWGHAQEVQPGWYNRVWRGWDQDKLIRGLHPTHPNAYGFTEKIQPPQILRDLLGDRLPASLDPLPIPTRWPTISVVTPLWGGEDDIKRCLDSLAPLHEEKLLHEVIVVDNASPDNAAIIASAYPFVTMLRNDENRGFAAASNQGAEVASGELLLFLNSDTIVSRSGMIRLVESLQKSHIIGAVGPFSNNASGAQGIASSYTRLETIEMFVDEFAQRSTSDLDVDFLVGFCMLIRRTAWDEVGGFDEQFGMGGFEDNDLSYRFRRKGYRLVVASQSFVHHSGSKTFKRMSVDVQKLFEENARKFHEKWRSDVESGYASHLSGTKADRIVFQQTLAPGGLSA